jgi:Kef-type K+ transport system membrane component KefB
VEPTLLITGFGIIIAALAGLLGFSFALGAFFAGLAFSRDPQAVRLDSSFEFVYELFTPFFFIGIGLHIVPSSIGPALAPGALLFIAAVAGKILGTGIPSLWFAGWKESLLLGVSMVPRAEIAMVIIQKGHDLGGWAMPEIAFGSMILVALMSCLVSPLILRNLMKRWPQAVHSRR